MDRAGGSFEFWAPGDGTCAAWRLGTWEADVQASRAGVAPGGRSLVEATETINLVYLGAPMKLRITGPKTLPALVSSAGQEPANGHVPRGRSRGES